MKSKLILCLLSFCFLFSINVYSALNAVGITLLSNGISFKKPHDPANEHRSASIAVPISAFLNDNYVLELSFSQSIGEVEIIVSQDGEIVYSSSEDIISSVTKNVLLPQDLSGSLLLEIKGENGAYAFGWFTIH